MAKYLKHFLLIGIIAINMAPAYVFSLDNLSSSLQPTGFRGINWGASKLDHPYLFTVYDSIDGVDTMHRELENLTFGSAKLAGIIYHFYNDQFYQVSMSIRSNNDHQLLLDEFDEELNNYISFIEDEMKIPVSIASVGPNRAQTIFLDVE